MLVKISFKYNNVSIIDTNYVSYLKLTKDNNMYCVEIYNEKVENIAFIKCYEKNTIEQLIFNFFKINDFYLNIEKIIYTLLDNQKLIIRFKDYSLRYLTINNVEKDEYDKLEKKLFERNQKEEEDRLLKEKKIDEIYNMLFYTPGNPGYEEAKEHFENNV